MSPPPPGSPTPGPRIKTWYRRLWQRCWRTVRGLIRLEDTPYRIAMGCAAGIFCSVLPVFGQTFVGMLLARVLRANVVASIPWSWLSNPATTLPIWYGCYLVGGFLWPGHDPVRWEDIDALLHRFGEQGWWSTLSSGGSLLTDIFFPTLLGSVLVGALAAVIGYFPIHQAVGRVQERRRRKAQEWGERVRNADR